MWSTLRSTAALVALFGVIDASYTTPASPLHVKYADAGCCGSYGGYNAAVDPYETCVISSADECLSKCQAYEDCGSFGIHYTQGGMECRVYSGSSSSWYDASYGSKKFGTHAYDMSCFVKSNSHGYSHGHNNGGYYHGSSHGSSYGHTGRPMRQYGNGKKHYAAYNKHGNGGHGHVVYYPTTTSYPSATYYPAPHKTKSYDAYPTGYPSHDSYNSEEDCEDDSNYEDSSYIAARGEGYEYTPEYTPEYPTSTKHHKQPYKTPVVYHKTKTHKTKYSYPTPTYAPRPYKPKHTPVYHQHQQKYHNKGGYRAYAPVHEHDSYKPKYNKPAKPYHTKTHEEYYPAPTHYPHGKPSQHHEQHHGSYPVKSYGNKGHGKPVYHKQPKPYQPSPVYHTKTKEYNAYPTHTPVKQHKGYKHQQAQNSYDSYEYSS